MHKRLILGLTITFLGILFSGPAIASDSNALQVKVLAKSSKSWDGSKLQPYLSGQPQVSILRIVVPPHTSLPLHKHPVINAGVLLRGQLTVVTDAKETLHLKEGEAIIEVVEKWHYGKNESDEPAEIIVFYAGVEHVNITEKKLPTQ